MGNGTALAQVPHQPCRGPQAPRGSPLPAAASGRRLVLTASGHSAQASLHVRLLVSPNRPSEPVLLPHPPQRWRDRGPERPSDQQALTPARGRYRLRPDPRVGLLLLHLGHHQVPSTHTHRVQRHPSHTDTPPTHTHRVQRPPTQTHTAPPRVTIRSPPHTHTVQRHAHPNRVQRPHTQGPETTHTHTVETPPDGVQRPQAEAPQPPERADFQVSRVTCSVVSNSL